MKGKNIFTLPWRPTNVALKNNFFFIIFEKGYILSEPALSPTANNFCTGSYASAVGWLGNPCRNVWKESKKKQSINKNIK